MFARPTALASPARSPSRWPRARSRSNGQVYRYEDAQGRVVYSDRAPAADAKKSESKRVTATSSRPTRRRSPRSRRPIASR